MRWSFVLIAIVVFGGPASARDLASSIDAVFSDISGERPGYALGIVRDGELVLARGYGLSDVSAGEPITADTAFDLASLSKQFTGAVIAQEILSGRLSLDDALSTHWPDLPAFMRPITIGHLVYMTSGLSEYYTLASPRGGWSSEHRFTVDDAIAAVTASGRLQFTPGERWAYSNTNYQLLAVLAARLNGTDFASLLAARVFDTLDMNRTWVDAQLKRPPGTARSYVEEGGRWREAPRLSAHYGGSGVFSTLRDLARWDAALHSRMAFGRDFTRLMLSTRKYAHAKQNDAFGLVHGAYRGSPIIWYEGGDYGVSTYMARLVAHDATVICLANFAEAGCAARAQRVMDILLDDDGHAAKR